MARRKVEEHNVRKLNKTSRGSVLLRLPIEHVRALRWRDKQKVVVTRKGKTLIIKDWKK